VKVVNLNSMKFLNKKFFKFLFLGLVISVATKAQSYTCTIQGAYQPASSPFPTHTASSYSLTDVNGNFYSGNLVSGTINVTITSFPNSLTINFSGGCSASDTFINATPCGGSLSKTTYVLSCEGNGYFVMTIHFRPTISILGSPSGTYCVNQNISLTGTPGWSNYTWYYKVQSGPWTAFATNTNSNYSFGIRDVFGSDYARYLNKTIYFGYGIAGCGLIIDLSSAYAFADYPPVVGIVKDVDYLVTNPTCAGGTGQIIINSLDRPLRNYETIVIHLYDDASTSANELAQVQATSLPVTIANLSPKTYHAFIQSYISIDGISTNVATPCTPSSLTFRAFTITAPDPLGISSSITSQISCYGANNGQITITPSGGSGNFLYSIDGGTTYQGSNIFSNLIPGNNYRPKIRESNDANCAISSNTPLTISSPSAITPGTVSITHPTCSGSDTGTIALNGSSGGTGSLSWSIDGNFQSVTNLFSNVSPGSHIATVRDANNCTAAIGTVVVNAPIAAAFVSTEASCTTINDGTITVTGATGGTGTYQYSLNNGTYQSGNTFTNLTGNNYTINVKDGNGCVFTISNAEVGLKPPVAGMITQTSEINCYGETTAAFNVMASGGTAPYASYNWSSGATGLSVSQAGAGKYSVTITDSKGCQGTSSITITEPQLLTTSLALSDYNGYGISCTGGSNGSIIVTPAGGTAPYSYAWSTGSTSQNIAGLQAGDYLVTTTDGKGCKSSASSTLTQPANALAVNIQSKNNITCFGANDGQITLTSSGGVGARSYSIDGNTFQLSQVFNSLAPDTYKIIAKDINGCIALTSDVKIETPTALAISSIIKSSPVCNGTSDGTLTIASSGGVAPYHYTLDGINYQDSKIFNGLTSGGYIIAIKDSVGCSLSSQLQTLLDPPLLEVSATGIPPGTPFTSDGKIIVLTTGGTGSTVYSLDGKTFQSTPSFTGLVAGPYQVTAQDANGCTQATAVLIPTVPLPPNSVNCLNQQFSISLINQVSPTCGLSNGSAKAAVLGGAKPYDIQWYDALGKSVAIGMDLQNMLSGTYTVMAIDSNRCAVAETVSFTKYKPAQIDVTTIKGTNCSDSADGSVEIKITGDNGPYAQQWSSAETTTKASKLTAGSNTVTVTDANDCSITKTFQVTSPTPLSSPKESVTNPVCAGGNQGAIQVTATGGTSPYSYSWNGVAGENNIQQVKAGKYELKITDANGCSLTKSYTLIDPPAFTIDLGATKTICPNTVTQIGLQIANATYQWTGPNGFSSTQGVVTVHEGGNYQLTVTSALGCKASSTVTVEVSNILLKADLLATSKASVGDTVVVIDISWPLPEKIEWVFPVEAKVISSDQDYLQLQFDQAGTYVVGVKSALGGCGDSHYQNIEIEAKSKTGGREASGGGLIVMVYPNPFETTAVVTIEQSEAEEIAMEVYELGNNEKIMSHTFSGSTSYEAELNFAGLKPGVYVVVVRAGSITKTIRVIKL
jgi:hypothetical protein